MLSTVRELVENWLFSPIMARFAILFLGIVLIAIAIQILRRGMVRYIQDSSTRYRARKLATFFGYLATVIFATLVFSEQLGGLTVAFGVAGAGVAFALQEVIASLAGWFSISLGHSYKVGDRIELGGIKGDVIDITLLRTTMMEIGGWVGGDQYNGRIARVSNSFVLKEPLYNYSGEFPFLWDEIMLPIKYGSDYHAARKIIEDVAVEVSGEYVQAAENAWTPITRRYVVEAASVRPMVSMTANSCWIEFVLRYVVDFKQRRSTKDRLFTRILEEIDRSGDRIGIAASTLNIEKLPPLDVRLSRADTGTD